MPSSTHNNGKVNSFRDNSPISKNNLFDELFPKDKKPKEQAKDNVGTEEKFAKIIMWSSEGMVQKELTYDHGPSNVTVFVKDKDTDIVLLRKLGSQWFTGNFVGVLSLGNDGSIEIYSRF